MSKGRSNTMKKPRSSAFRIMTHPRTTPNSTATVRLGRGFRSRATATMSGASTGMRANPATPMSLVSLGTTRVIQTTRPATIVVATARAGRRLRMLRSGASTSAIAPDAGIRQIAFWREIQPRVPQLPGLATERLTQQDERAGEAELLRAGRKDVGRDDREGDALNSGHDLAPLARRNGATQPGKHQPCRDECIPREADREHPPPRRLGDIHAEDENQERVDLHVEARTEA